MSNVFSNASFAVLSVMQTKINSTFLSATAYVQRKPEANYGNVITVSWTEHEADEADFNVQDRFEANIAPNIMQRFGEMKHVSTGEGFNEANSNISVKSYRLTAVEYT